MYKEEINFINDDIKIDVNILRVVKGSYHCHRDIELVYVIDGTIEAYKVDHKYVLTKGDMYIMNSDDIHKLQSDDKNNVILVAHMSEELIKEKHGALYNEMVRCRYIKSLCGNDYLCNERYINEKRDVVQVAKEYLFKIYVINNLYKKGINDGDGFGVLKNYKGIINDYYNKLITLILNEFSLMECFQRLCGLDNEMRERNYKFMRYISENYSKKITLDHLSKELNLSKYYISRILNQKDFGGISIESKYLDFGGLNGYIRDFRAHKGRYLLFMTDKSIGEISEIIGFNSAGTFINGFKEAFGFTPAEYRKMYKGGKEETITHSLDEEAINEILKDNIVDYLEFSRSSKCGENLNIDVNALDKLKSNKVMPKFEFVLKSDNPVYDIYKLKERDSLYSIDFSNCKIVNEDKLEREALEYKYGRLLECIRENKDVQEKVSIEELISQEGIETNLYYYYSILNMMKSNIVKYNNDYLITRDEKCNYTIFILIKSIQKFTTDVKINIKLDKKKTPYKIMLHKLKKNNLDNIVIESDIEREVVRRSVMPRCSFEIVNVEEYVINARSGEQYLIEITK